MRREAFPIDAPTALAWLRSMLLIRRFEERSAQEYSAGKIHGFLHLYIGQEACAVGVISQLASDDPIVSHYREHGHALMRGVPARAVMAEMFGKREGCSHGRGGSMHLFDVSRHFYGGNAIVAGGMPLAAGLALADKQLGRPRVTVCLIGDGSVAEGAFHETMNLASLWKLPVLFVCENNLYAMGTALSRHQAQTDLTAKAASYRMRAEAADGMDVLAVADAAEARDRLRPRRRGARLPRAEDVPVPSALDVRPRALPRPEGGRGLEEARPDRAASRPRSAVAAGSTTPGSPSSAPRPTPRCRTRSSSPTPPRSSR